MSQRPFFCLPTSLATVSLFMSQFVAEIQPSENTSALDVIPNLSQNNAMESTHISSRLDASIIEDYIPGGSSDQLEELRNRTSSPDGRMQVASPSTTRDLDLQRLLLEKTISEVKNAHKALQQQAEKTTRSPGFIVKSVASRTIGCVPPPTNKKLTEKMGAVEEAQRDLDTVVNQFGVQRVEDLFSEIAEDPEKITVVNIDQGIKEKAPIAQSFKFGILIRQELQQLQQKTIDDKLAGKIGAFGRREPFEDMMVDLARTHERDNVKFSLIEGQTTTTLNQESGQANLTTFKDFVGKNEHLQIAIASVMHQGGQSDFEKIKLGVHRDPQAPTSLPFFTAGINAEMWRPSLEGPIFMKLFSGKNKTESQSYYLKKFTTEDHSPVFQLTTTCAQSVADPDFNYLLTRGVTYQFEKNPIFNSALPISEINSPVTVTCLEGKIVQSFNDVRTPEQFNHQAAQYNLTVYQKRLEALGDPHEIETNYQKRIQFLRSRAASRPGAVMTEDRNAAEAKLQQLRKAQQDVQTAQQELARAQRHLTGLSGGERSDDENEWED